MPMRLTMIVEIKQEIPSGLESVTPLDLRTDLRMMMPGVDTTLQEKQLQQELLLIQKQQQIQKQLLITEFQKQHENLMRQHQAQLQEHVKVFLNLKMNSVVLYLSHPCLGSCAVELKTGIPSGLESVTPLDLRTDLRMMMPGVDTTLQEKQLQQELLLIQKQQQIQKQLLITEFQKQHENLMRQHQAQLQEHVKEVPGQAAILDQGGTMRPSGPIIAISCAVLVDWLT
ncbi:UNVERIFIED_CONTAM: hypothetical protein FKN15_049961 [Acipenser sinensis]